MVVYTDDVSDSAHYQEVDDHSLWYRARMAAVPVVLLAVAGGFGLHALAGSSAHQIEVTFDSGHAVTTVTLPYIVPVAAPVVAQLPSLNASRGRVPRGPVDPAAGGAGGTSASVDAPPVSVEVVVDPTLAPAAADVTVPDPAISDVAPTTATAAAAPVVTAGPAKRPSTTMPRAAS
ncbi:MAG: hypothetical protein JWM12_354, partial [Ilumatobacteraceae bacterium]|nr:hypothetical protein [Ilumatobacteraceae bacterium]